MHHLHICYINWCAFKVKNNQYYLEGTLALLDYPGEWVYQQDTKMLHVCSNCYHLFALSLFLSPFICSIFHIFHNLGKRVYQQDVVIPMVSALIPIVISLAPGDSSTRHNRPMRGAQPSWKNCRLWSGHHWLGKRDFGQPDLLLVKCDGTRRPADRIGLHWLQVPIVVSPDAFQRLPSSCNTIGCRASRNCSQLHISWSRGPCPWDCWSMPRLPTTGGRLSSS